MTGRTHPALRNDLRRMVSLATMESSRHRTARYLRLCLRTLRTGLRDTSARDKLRQLLIAVVYYEAALGTWTTSEDLRYSVRRVARHINRLMREVENNLPT